MLQMLRDLTVKRKIASIVGLEDSESVACLDSMRRVVICLHLLFHFHLKDEKRLTLNRGFLRGKM